MPEMKSVLGHLDQKERFRRTLQRGRLASTYLLVGPAGVGKRTFAEGLAASLLCKAPREDPLSACGSCPSCQQIEAGSHPDLLSVARPDGKTTLPLDLFLGPPDKRNREGLCHELALKPLLADRRIALIDDADHFSVESANCLLKTLEEPPPRSLLLLIGTSLSRQLSTIRSRSQIIRFGRLASDQVAEILSAKPHELEPEEAQRLAEVSQGSVGRALELRGAILEQAFDLLEKCLVDDRIDPIDLARVLEEESKAVATEPRIRRWALRELLSAMVRVFHSRLNASAEQPQKAERILGQLEACCEAEESLSRNANQSAVVQSLALRVSAASL